MKILLVEDSPTALRCLETMCQELGYKFTSARDGIEALEVFDQHQCVLMDLHLPVLDGWDCARVLLERAPQTYIIACTSNVAPDHQAYCYSVGMAEFLTKPVDLETLREALQRAEKFCT